MKIRNETGAAAPAAALDVIIHFTVVSREAAPEAAAVPAAASG